MAKDVHKIKSQRVAEFKTTFRQLSSHVGYNELRILIIISTMLYLHNNQHLAPRIKKNSIKM